MIALFRIVCVGMLLAHGATAQPQREDFSSYGPPDAETRVLVRGTTDIALFAPVLEAFVAQRSGMRIDYEQWSSNDLYLVTEAECRAGQSRAALVVSSSIDQQVKLANDGCATAHRSAETGQLPPVANWRDEVFGITREPAVIVYNAATIGTAQPPRSRFDLIDLLRPEESPLRGRVATYDIEVSGLGYLFAFADAQQATTFGSLIEAFGRSGAVASCCSTDLIDGVADGRYLVSYNVLGSYALARAMENPDLVVVAPNDYTLVLSRAALIPRHAPDAETAGALVDYLLSEDGTAVLRAANLIVNTSGDQQSLLRLPENPEVSLRPIALSPALLVGLDRHKRKAFIARWRATFAQ